MIKGTIKGKISFPNVNLDLTRELERIAQREIIPDIQGRINQSVDIDGRSYRLLSPKTIAIKRRKGLRLEPLIATGQLRRSFKHKKSGRNRVIVYLSGGRKDSSLSNSQLGEILQIEGVRTRSGKRRFKFFGISDQAEGRAIASMKRAIRKAIRDARSTTI